MAERRRQRGIGHFEFAIVVALIGALSLALLERLTAVEAEAERLEVELTIRNIRVGLQLAIGERLMRGEEDRLYELLRANPLDFLGRRPEGYLGETAAAGGPGSWRYDPQRGALAYRPRQPEAFAGREELNWHLRASGESAGRPVGLRLEAG